ncbi:MAG: superoxide dismutase family protein [Candidatus Dadabacteria bacterium]|nr:MAG: superoxide dismutase family protein [Candidatus Dadabacteria bacterium]
MAKRTGLVAAAGAALLVVIGCRTAPAAAPAARHAVAVLSGTAGSAVHGKVVFTPVEGGVRIVADVYGLAPGKHGFHIHTNGDCSAPDGTSAGGHFNPAGTPHGAPEAGPEHRHAGDLGNLEADQATNAHYDRVDKVISLDGPNSIVGRAVIVHAGADDLKSQPSGAAGRRVACGVIGIVEGGH